MRPVPKVRIAIGGDMVGGVAPTKYLEAEAFWIRDGLAVTHPYAQNQPQPGFVITHIQTGGALGSPAYVFDTATEAIAAAEAVLPLCDWTKTYKQIMRQRHVVEMAPGILESAGGEA